MARITGKRATLDKNSIAVIGEGLTEQYYLQSIPNIKAQITPKLPKHSTGYKFLEDKIKECIDEGFSKIYVLIDMDNKKNASERDKYLALKNKFHNKIKQVKSQGTESEIIFFENERCLETWFLFHFKDTSTEFTSQGDLIKELKKHCDYEKSEKFFLSTRGLHQYFIRKGGDLNNAKHRATESLERKNEHGIDYTYSEMNDFFKLVERRNE